MRTLIITLITLFLYTGSALAETKTTRFYDKKGSFCYKTEQKGSKINIFKPNGERIGYGETTKNGVVIYDTKGNKVLEGKGIIQPY